MSRTRIQFLAAVALTIAAIVAFTLTVRAGELHVMKPFAPSSIGAAKNGAAYFMLSNGSASADRLLSASTDAARKVEIHNHLMENGVMKMRKVDGLEVPAGGHVMFKPGGYHLMFFGLNKPFKKGDTIKVELTFEKAGKTEVMIPVIDRKDMPKAHTMGN